MCCRYRVYSAGLSLAGAIYGSAVYAVVIYAAVIIHYTVIKTAAQASHLSCNDTWAAVFFRYSYLNNFPITEFILSALFSLVLV